MKKVLMIFMVFLFFVGSVNSHIYVRDDDSYYIYFTWSHNRSVLPGGLGYNDLNSISISAARLTQGFNVYAMNNSLGVETDRVVDHSAYPDWYLANGWDVADFEKYLIIINTHAEVWALLYVEYGRGEIDGEVHRVNIPMSGTTKQITFNDDGSVDIELEENGGDWRIWWGVDTPWTYDNVKLQDKHFIAHIDFENKIGYITPKQLVPEEE